MARDANPTAADAPRPLALDDITVVDASWLLPGQYCSMVLAELGARVIKIELPAGDYSRRWDPHGYAAVNRGKEGLTLNLRLPAAREVLYRLIARADVFLEGFRPRVMPELQADYATLSAIQPGLIYCSISGYGQDGPSRDRPGHGVNYAGVAGMLTFGGDGVTLAAVMSDLAASVFAAISILAAVRDRDRRGRGQYIDLAITDATYALMADRLAGPDDGRAQPMAANGETTLPANRGAFGIFRAGDGELLTLGAVEDRFWQLLCQAVGRSEWGTDPRYATDSERRRRGGEIQRLLSEVLATRPRSDWLTKFEAAGVPCGPLNSPAGARVDAHAAARELITQVAQPGVGEVSHVRFPAVFSELGRRQGVRAPDVGEHNLAILEELGYSSAEIAQLRELGAI